MNEILWGVIIITSFSSVLLEYKLFGKYGLFMWVAIATIIANIETVKIVDIFGIETALGTVLYGSTFLATDILNYKYGRNEAKKTILIGFVSMVLMTFFMTMSLKFIPSANDFSQSSLETIFNLNLRITIASIIAFVVSQSIDTYLFQKIQKKYNKIWLSNNLSTMICQIFDTIIFVLITYYGTLNIKTIIEIMISMYIFKLAIALLDTPFMYLSLKIKAKK